MMPDLGQYAGAVLSAYGVSAVLILALLLRTLQRNAKSRAALEKLEETT